MGRFIYHNYVVKKLGRFGNRFGPFWSGPFRIWAVLTIHLFKFLNIYAVCRNLLCIKINCQFFMLCLIRYREVIKHSAFESIALLIFNTRLSTKDTYKWSFFPRTVICWNSLPLSVVQSKSVDIFREQLSPAVLQSLHY